MKRHANDDYKIRRTLAGKINFHFDSLLESKFNYSTTMVQSINEDRKIRFDIPSNYFLLAIEMKIEVPENRYTRYLTNEDFSNDDEFSYRLLRRIFPLRNNERRKLGGNVDDSRFFRQEASKVLDQTGIIKEPESSVKGTSANRSRPF